MVPRASDKAAFIKISKLQAVLRNKTKLKSEETASGIRWGWFLVKINMKNRATLSINRSACQKTDKEFECTIGINAD